MRGTLLSAVLLAATLGGCYASGDVGYNSTPSGTVYASTPDLVTVSPGVQVVADYDEPVFYSNGFYWRYYDNGWYRSNNYAAGWSYYERPPEVVLRIDRPYAYAHYRPAGYVARNPPRARAEVIVRDQRAPVRAEPVRAEPVVRERVEVRGGATVRPAPAAPAPVVRDHRAPPPPPRKEVVRDHRD